MDPHCNLLRQIIAQQSLPEQLQDSLDNTEYGDELIDYLNKTAALLRITKEISNFDSLDSLLNSVIQIACKTCTADIGSLFLYDSLTDELYSRITAEKEEIRIDKDSGIIGAVFLSGDALIVDDVYEDERFYKKVDEKTGYRTKSMLCVPIKTKTQEIIGTLQLINKKQGNFDETDLMLMEFVSNQASSSLQMAQLLEETERKRKMEAQILEMSTAIANELKLDQLLIKIMDLTTSILQAERSTLFLYDPKTDELWSKVAVLAEVKEIRMAKDKGIAGSVFLSKETINIKDAYADPRFNQEVDHKTGYRTHSILCMPVLNKQKFPIGIIQVLNKNHGSFSKFDEVRLGAVAAQAFVAIENARLFEEVLGIKNYNENILESMTNGVVTLDADKNIIKWNSQALKILKVQKNELRNFSININFKEFLGSRNRHAIQLIYHVISRGVTEQLIDMELSLQNGQTIIVNLSVIPLLDSQRELKGTLLIFEDISQDKRVKQMLSRYLSSEVMQELIYSPEGLKLGGELKEVTFLISDLRGFTCLSVDLAAQDIVAILNRYLNYMAKIITDNGGTIDEFQGDGILAFFGAPLDFSDDAQRAVTCAVEMQLAMEKFNQEQLALNLPRLEMGIGIHTGTAVVGNIGSEIRAKYGAVGSAINLAFRVESCTKGGQVLLSESTYLLVQDNILISDIIKADLKGISETKTLYNLVSSEGLKLPNTE